MMSPTEPAIRNISDTALWAAVFRARETERPDGLFRDPYARRLAGERGDAVIESLPGGDRNSWAWATRTYLFDRILREQIGQGSDMVVNLAAGLDARPYRMDLPPGLQWIEVDLPDILAYKEDVLVGETPRCALERIRLDLADVGARRELFQSLGRRAEKALILTEGLLIYLTPAEAGALAADLAAPPGFQRWALDLASPGLLRMLQKQWNRQLGRAGAPLQFGPEEGPGFFAAHGWRPVEVSSMLGTAVRVKRAPLGLRLLAALLPDSPGRKGSRPWSAVCLYERQG